MKSVLKKVYPQNDMYGVGYGIDRDAEWLFNSPQGIDISAIDYFKREKDWSKGQMEMFSILEVCGPREDFVPPLILITGELQDEPNEHHVIYGYRLYPLTERILEYLGGDFLSQFQDSFSRRILAVLDRRIKFPVGHEERYSRMGQLTLDEYRYKRLWEEKGGAERYRRWQTDISELLPNP